MPMVAIRWTIGRRIRRLHPDIYRRSHRSIALKRQAARGRGVTAFEQGRSAWHGLKARTG